MRHPFQRSDNDKNTVQTPFQRALVDFIAAYSKGGEKMSGRRLSELVGKSANHISQMLNDGFVPSGKAILEMAEVLDLAPPQTDHLIRAAMETKASQRSRDSFWINQSTRMLAEAEGERELVMAFLEREGLVEAFEAFATKTRKSKR